MTKLERSPLLGTRVFVMFERKRLCFVFLYEKYIKVVQASFVKAPRYILHSTTIIISRTVKNNDTLIMIIN